MKHVLVLELQLPPNDLSDFTQATCFLFHSLGTSCQHLLRTVSLGLTRPRVRRTSNGAWSTIIDVDGVSLWRRHFQPFFPEMFSLFRKNGHSFNSISKDSLASAADMGTGEDLMTAFTTSDIGNARRFLFEGVDVDDPETGPENNLKGKLHEGNRSTKRGKHTSKHSQRHRPSGQVNNVAVFPLARA